MPQAIAFSHRTRVGTFWIRLGTDGRWHALFEDEGLGSYKHPAGAAEDIANGTTFWPSCGDPSALGISEELSDWQAYSAR